MITLTKLMIKFTYWIFIGWWLEPIKYFKRKKMQKMEDEITKAKYKELKEKEKKEEN